MTYEVEVVRYDGRRSNEDRWGTLGVGNQTKFLSATTNVLLTPWAASFCKSVGVCLRRFESCTCNTANRASDQHVCRSEALHRCAALSGQIRLFAPVRAEVVRKVRAIRRRYDLEPWPGTLGSSVTADDCNQRVRGGTRSARGGKTHS
jgi:hypothetical protein